MRDKHSEREQGGAASEGARKAPQTDHLGYARLLGRIDLFMGLERVTLAKLAAHIEPLFYPSHSIIFRQAEPADAFYLVASGSVGVYYTGPSHSADTPVKILHAGEPFGEMALLTNSTRTATIKAETDCEVLRLDAVRSSISYGSSRQRRFRSPPYRPAAGARTTADDASDWFPQPHIA
jgi:hypothetical protein